jgi:Domain of unknown function (DUF4129)
LALAGLLYWKKTPVWRRNRRVFGGADSAVEATVLYEKMLRKMRRRGFEKPPWFTPAEFAATLPDSELANCVSEFTEGYQALRFGGDPEARGELVQLLARLEAL